MVCGAPRTYTPEMLERYNARDIEYNGRMYTEYEASQIQRGYERSIRRWKRENAAMSAAGLDATDSAIRLRSTQAGLRDFLKQTGLKRQSDREQIAGIVEKLENRSIIKLSPKAEKSLAAMGIEDVAKYKGKLSNRATRRWYITQNARIPELVDKTLSLESQARQACNMRNANRNMARELMRDKSARRLLDEREKNLDFGQLLERKSQKYGLTGNEAYEAIIKSAATTRKEVNKALGLEDEE